MPIAIKVISDFICPWCYIGALRLARAIETLRGGIDVSVEWLSYELNPDMPKEGMERRLYRERKFGSWERSLAMDANTKAAGAEDGAVFNYERMTRTANSFEAHRLSWLAAREGTQRAVVEGILKAYFAEGRDIGDRTVLSAIAGEAGMDRDAVRAFLDGQDGTEAVRALEASAYRKGVQGVPHFDIGGLSVSGAQSADVLRRAITHVHARKAMAASSGGL